MRTLFLILMLFVCGFSEDVLFIGNSRTSGIPDIICQQITTGLGYSTYSERGHGGQRTQFFLNDLPTDLAEVNPTVVILCVHLVKDPDDRWYKMELTAGIEKGRYFDKIRITGTTITSDNLANVTLFATA